MLNRNPLQFRQHVNYQLQQLIKLIPSQIKNQNSLLHQIEELIRDPFGLNSSNSNSTNDSFNDPSYHFEENQFNNCLISEIRTINDWNIFNEDDWRRVMTIVERNTNVDSTGQFNAWFFPFFLIQNN